ncbi:MAG: hypothetical protein KF841_05170 [Phycisphaerae bacterium]|nr:hypothetical protein [Phycisphaerae bacterium]
MAFALAAAILSALMVQHAIRPDAIISALTQSETQSAEANARPIEEAFWDRLRADPNGPNRAALSSLMNTFNRVDLGEEQPASVMNQAAAFVAADLDNLTSRIAYAVLNDRAILAEKTDADHDVETGRRFASMREIIEGSTPARRAKLYSAPLFDIWAATLEGRFNRADVMASLRWQMRRLIHVDPRLGAWRALPKLISTLTELANALRVAGRDADAALCDQWAAACAWGVLDSERDAPTRLLAADLLAQATRQTAAQIALGARKFRSDFVARAAAADIDFCNQGWTAARSVAPSEYRTSITFFIAALTAVAIAVGAAVTLVTAILLLPFAWWIRTRRQKSIAAPADPSEPISASAAAAVISKRGVALTQFGLIIAYIAAVSLRLRFDQFYSITAFIDLAIVTLGAGAATALAGAAAANPAWRIGRIISIGLAAALALLCALPVAAHAWIGRFFGLTLLSDLVFFPVVVGIIASAGILIEASLRRIARSAAVTWLLAAAIGMLLYYTHSAVDRTYQAAVVAAYPDEVAARLGPDWRQTYFAEAAARYQPDKP